VVYFEVSKLKYIIRMNALLSYDNKNVYFNKYINGKKILLIVNFHIVECYYNCV